jgi:hypothetical protein
MVLRTSIVVLVLFIISCKTTYLTNTDAEIAEPKPQILFLQYHLKQSNSKFTAQLTAKSKVEGKFKSSNEVVSRMHSSDLKMVQLDIKNKPLDSLFIDDPLHEEIEYVNTNNEFEKKIIQKDSADFFVRIQLHPKTKFISIYYSEKQLSKDEL